MLHLRILAAIVSMLSLVTVILALIVGAGVGVAVALLAAAACLAIVSPFDAPNPPERTRVALACLAYLVPLAAAFALAKLANASMMLLVAIVILAQFGIVLAGWALATRKRRRIPRSRRYYDY